METQSVLGQTSEGTQWLSGESNVCGFDVERMHSLIAYPKAHCVSKREEF